MSSGSLFVVSAPSGAGKTSLIRAVMAKSSRLELSLSVTTRAPRPGEKDGVDYRFISEDEFNERVAAGEFLEHARVFDHFYGTSRRELEARLEQDVDVILDIDWQGARRVREQMPDCTSVFILPPSLGALEQRLVARGQDSDAVIRRRMREAREQASHFDEYDYLIVNDAFEEAVADLEAIFHAGRLKTGVQRQRHATALTWVLA